MDILDWVRALVALVVTLALIGLAAIAARRLGMLQGATPGQPRRLRVMERLMLDPRRSLVILRCDSQEHLVLLSPFGEKNLGMIVGPPSLAGEGPVSAEIEPARFRSESADSQQAADRVNEGERP